MVVAHCIGCATDFDPAPRRSDTKHCPACEPLRKHKTGARKRLPVAVLRSLGTTCAICAESIDLYLKAPHPRACSVDHIVPVAAGGTDELENLQISHLQCNQIKHLRERATPKRARSEYFSQTYAWRKFSKSILSQRPPCVRCAEPGARVFRKDQDADPFAAENIEVLCMPCAATTMTAMYHRDRLVRPRPIL